MGAHFSESEFTAIWESFAKDVYAFCYSLLRNVADSEDATQESFLLLYQKGVRKDKDIKAYLMAAAYHKSIDLLRKRSLRPSPLPEEVPSQEDPSPDERLFQAVSSLKARYRKVILLHYYGQLTSEEIAHVLHLSALTVLKRLERARKQLKEDLEYARV